MGEREHHLRIERLGNQQYVARCLCGWVGTQKNGKPFWGREGAFGAVLQHQKEQGLPLGGPPNYVDLAPPKRRGKGRNRG